MNKKDLDALGELYSSVYGGENLNEEPKNDLGYRLGRGISGALRDLPSGLAGQLTGKVNPALRRQMQRGENLNRLITTGKLDKPKTSTPSNQSYKSKFSGSRDAAVAKAKQIQGSPVVGSKSTPQSSSTPARPAAPAARPAAAPSGGAKVSPSSASKPAGTPMQQWAAANPKLATKVTPSGTQMGTGQSQMSKQAAEIRSMRAASQLRQQGANVTSSDIKAEKPSTAPKVAAATQQKPKPPSTQLFHYDWPSSKTLKDLADAYASVYEAKKVDQDNDGDNDFADVRIARMIASGVPKEVAIAKVKNKSYNEELDFIDEAEAIVGSPTDAAKIKAREAIFQNQEKQRKQPSIYGLLPRTSLPQAKKQSTKKLQVAEYQPEYQLVDEKYMGFKALKASIAAKGGVRDPGAVAAAIGRKKYGKEKFQAAAAKGRKLGEENTLDEATAMAKRGYDEAPIRQKIAKNTGGGESADRATKLENQPTYGNAKKAKQRQRLARAQRGDFRKTTSSSPGLHGYAHKSNDPKVKAKQAARGAQRGVLTPAEKKQLNREAYEIYEIVVSYLLENNFAETMNDANVIIENMSEKWYEQILEETI